MSDTSKSESEIEYDTCMVCCSDIPGRSVICPKPDCSFLCCRTCVKKYLLSKQNKNPMCMACKSEWDFGFLSENTENSFHNKTYREHRAKILLEEEKAMLPTSQHLARDYRDYQECKEYLSTLYKLQKKYQAKLKKVNDAIRAKKTEANNIKYKHTGYTGIGLGANKEDVPKYTGFLGHCPEDDCKGYITDKYMCGICDIEVCKKCRKVKHENDCNKDDVASVKFLAQDTKPCPTCHIPIHKISGCSQMWCPSCKTAFSWETGKIERGRIHNPHFYEWQRQQGLTRREPGDIRCGGPVRYTDVITKLQIARISKDDINLIGNVHMAVGHIRDVIRLHYTHAEPNGETHQDLRLKYLIDKITEKDWQKELKKREKRREKLVAIRLVLDMACDSMDSLLENIVATNITEVPVILPQFSTLREYINNSLKKIGDRLKNKVPYIEKDWTFTGVSEVRHHRELW